MLPQPAAKQHPSDGLKPSLEIAPPGATPIHSGCPLGEGPYGSEDAQKGVSPQALPPPPRAVAGVLQTGNPGWKSVMSRNLRCPLAAQCHPGLCEKSHRSHLAISHRHGHPGVRLEDLRAQTFYVTLPPRTSLGPLNAKTQKSSWFRQRATALPDLRTRARRSFSITTQKT